jgi:hypothetical protein
MSIELFYIIKGIDAVVGRKFVNKKVVTYWFITSLKLNISKISILIQESSLRATTPENIITVEQIPVKLSFLDCENRYLEKISFKNCHVLKSAIVNIWTVQVIISCIKWNRGLFKPCCFKTGSLSFMKSTSRCILRKACRSRRFFCFRFA